jgi:hypothetical protein
MLAHLLLAPLTLVIAAVFILVSRISRWRLWWLLGPVAVGLAWIVLIGPGQALADFAAWPASVLRHFGANGSAGRTGHPEAAISGIGSRLSRQLPLALPLAAAEAAVAGWLHWLHTDEWAVPAPRPGAVAALRAAVATRRIRSGAVLTRDGCVLGVAPATGAAVAVDWAEISRGLLVTGADEREVTTACLQLVHAALRRRKPVFVLDDRQSPGIAGALAAACRATGAPLHGDDRFLAGEAAHMRSAAAAGGAARMRDPVRADGLGQRGGAVARGAASASQLWGRAAAPERPDAGVTQVDLRQVVSERSAALLTALSPELAASACAGLAVLAADLRRIGVDGDALVWIPHAERVPAQALGALLSDSARGGLAVLIATTSPASAAELGRLAGAALIRRVTDPAFAATLATLTGTRLLPLPAAAAGPGSSAKFAVPTAFGSPGGLAAGGLSAGGLAPEFVACPAVAAPFLLALGPGEFVLAVGGPRPRLVAPGRMVPARLPRMVPARLPRPVDDPVVAT